MTDDQKMAKRLEIVAEARTWLDTPYRHQGAVKGRAVDCVNMVNEVLIACGVHARRPLPAYRTRPHPDGRLRGQVEGYMTRIPVEQATVGDVLMFAVHGRDTHLAILTGPDTIIHAYLANRRVCEHSMGSVFGALVSAAFRAEGL